ncbi:MAG TPA: hypothetical protein VF069_05350 [Streptosporangiaceae bacterium]
MPGVRTAHRRIYARRPPPKIVPPATADAGEVDLVGLDRIYGHST